MSVLAIKQLEIQNKVVKTFMVADVSKSQMLIFSLERQQL